MFDFVRKHTKIMMFLMFLLIIPAFVLVGIDGYNRSRDRGEAVARVNGHDISQAEWDNAHRIEVDRLRASMPNLDSKFLDSPAARYATLERLVRDRVLVEAATKLGLTTSDARLARELQDNPTIASLRRADGTLDMERYRQLAGSQGMTPEMFEASVRSDLSTKQVLAGVANSGFATMALSDVALNAYYEKREVQVARFPTSDFTSKVKPTDAELEAFYQANQGLFQAPEQASIEYIVLDLNAIKQGIVISEQDVRSYYDQNAAQLSGNEERRASHILINAPKGAPEAERQKARARAEELLAAVRKAPASFADVARKNSQDTGSAPKGGDLDFFGRGAMVKPFEDAAFAMKKDEISDLVESDFGYHIIKLTDIKTPKRRSFEELRAGIEADLKAQQAQRKFAEVAETFTNMVYEQSDSLKPVAERLKLEIKTATNLQRNPVPGATGVLANPKFLSAVFGPDAVEKKRNTEAVETGPNQLTAGRITQYTAAHTLPLAEVRERVRERVVASRAAEMARKEGMEKLESWKANPASASFGAVLAVSRDSTQNLPAQVTSAALRADPAALPVLQGVDLGAQGYAILRVNKVLPRPAPPANQAKQAQAQYSQLWSDAEGQAYYKQLMERFKVQIKVAPSKFGTP
ncbi:MAG: SurA N-terminal domain-containing protein [Gammaproteobacteria bacterium]|nr:SurA N-terminal domain-containing protein [Gammaproteobacteria bacterium]MBU0786340.1 SurA N-terminal domain-containing protein [Gammaproteobacteria bacterium]MBU0814440.1 SurA N-terminal domain-containing protein [Gammaproteobacteria bacterium]MBU1786717.1 SurA N-terminal domain-containing protein [Gammaproteobacteria bacterium]